MNTKNQNAIALTALVVMLLPLANSSLKAQGHGAYYTPSGPHPIYYGNVLNPGASRGSAGYGTNSMPDVGGRFINHTYTMPTGANDTFPGGLYLDGISYGYPDSNYLIAGGLTRPMLTTTVMPKGYRAQIHLTVPANAEVRFDNQHTTQIGPSRSFSTAILEQGRTYRHEVRVTWKVGDHEMVVIRQIDFQAGSQINLDLSAVAGGLGMETVPKTIPATVSGIIR